jgi:hypothetical protein
MMTLRSYFFCREAPGGVPAAARVQTDVPWRLQTMLLSRFAICPFYARAPAPTVGDPVIVKSRQNAMASFCPNIDVS